MSRVCVYTCITNGYDKLTQVPARINTDVDFICFTDNQRVPDNGWTLRSIPDYFLDFPRNKIQRMVKILPHKFLQKYDVSVWVDGNIVVMCDILRFLSSLDLEKHFMYVRRHPTRTDVVQESRAIIKLGKDTRDIIDRQLEKYRIDGFPVDRSGMVESNILVRKHNDIDCQRLMYTWANEVQTWSHRDQMSFNYSLWKTGLFVGEMGVNNLQKDPRFRLIRHDKRLVSRNRFGY